MILTIIIVSARIIANTDMLYISTNNNKYNISVIFVIKISIINISYERAWVVGRGFKNIFKIVMYSVFTHILYNTRLQGSAWFIVG